MRRVYRFGLLGLGCTGLLLVVLIAGKPSPDPAPTPPVPVPAPAAKGQSQGEHVQQAGQVPLTQTHVKELARLEEEQRKRRQAATGRQLARERLQLMAQDGWSTLLATNSAAFLALRKQATQSTHGETPCTLCDGAGYQNYCVLCPGGKGKCAGCKGSGRLSAAEYCPTCEGSGRCFLCFGYGRMNCPFCDSGRIRLDRPLPPARLPID